VALSNTVETSALIGTLNTQIEQALNPRIPQNSRVALIDFPNHANVGDSAIWLGERAMLKKFKLKDTYNCDWRTYSISHMAQRITDDTIILIQGGGNVGDIWPEAQEFREAIITGFPNNSIVQLPQSISFSDASNLQRAKEVFENHPKFTLFIRDKPSLAFAKENFKCSIALCPDMAFQLGSLPRPNSPSKKVVWLLRTDKESKGFTEQAREMGLEPCDWLSETANFEKVNRVITGLWKPGQDIWRRLDFCTGPIYDLTAQARLTRGLQILSAGETVVTDRLHVHILCVLMGIPHVILDNSYGKVKNYFDTWMTGSSLVHVADSLPKAQELIDALIG